MDIQQLRAFVAVVDEGSYVAASRVLPASRVTLRSRVEALELAAGVPLVVVDHQGVRPTEAGAWLLDRARRLVAQAEELLRGVQSRNGEVGGELRLMLPVGFPPDLVGAFVTLVHHAHPNLQIRLDVCATQSMAAEFDPDIVVHWGPPWGDPSWRTVVLTRIPHVLLGARAYVDDAGIASTGDLLAHPFLALDIPGLDPRVLPLRDGGSLDIEPWFTSANTHLVRTMVAAGSGLALLPQTQLTSGVPGEDLVAVLDGQVGLDLEVRALIPEAKASSPRCRAVLDLMAHMRDMGPGVVPPSSTG